tara:strand:+ start:778 stop:1344 length:567 start_codon:yes stop_codon:yes gene_type:complete
MGQKILVLTSIASIFAGILFAIGFNTTLEATNTTEFCTSCHSMQWNKKEWMESIHFKNASGVRAECKDCHVPHPMGPKLYAKFMAAKDIWGEITGSIDTKDKFEKHRWEMANKVWKKQRDSNSRECKSCHIFSAFSKEEQDRIAYKKHKKAERKGMACIDCHKGVAHKPPTKPDKKVDNNTGIMLSNY